jgi:3-oxoacyl-[acyl-carrier protein] reductase
VRITEKKIVITGGASGLGLASAMRLASRGASVWALDRDPAALDSAARAAEEWRHLHFLACDVGDEEQVAGAVERIERDSGGIEVLINNAAVLRDQALVGKLRGKTKKHSLIEWHETLRSNLTAAFLMGREVAEVMVRAGRGGLIINVSSVSRRGNAGQSAYAASKGGLDALTATWAQELAAYGIRVAGIAPGFVETPMTRRIPPFFLERIKTLTPLKRFGTLEEFASAVEFVIENDYLHGKVLELDGGLKF